MPTTFKVDVDTSYLRFDVNHHKFYDNICKAIPQFAKYESEYATAEATKVRFFAWIVLMYDMNSPLRREIRDMYKRKVYAASLCGLTPNAATGKYREPVERILTGIDPEFNELVAAYISHFYSPEYKKLLAHEAMQDNALMLIINGKADKNTQQLFDAASDTVTQLTRTLFGSAERDEVEEARKALYKQVAYDLSDMRPEQVARAIADGKGLPDSWNPYESGYKPGDIKFVGDDLEIARNDEESLP